MPQVVDVILLLAYNAHMYLAFFVQCIIGLPFLRIKFHFIIRLLCSICFLFCRFGQHLCSGFEQFRVVCILFSFQWKFYTSTQNITIASFQTQLQQRVNNIGKYAAKQDSAVADGPARLAASRATRTRWTVSVIN